MTHPLRARFALVLAATDGSPILHLATRSQEAVLYQLAVIKLSPTVLHISRDLVVLSLEETCFERKWRLCGRNWSWSREGHTCRRIAFGLLGAMLAAYSQCLFQLCGTSECSAFACSFDSWPEQVECDPIQIHMPPEQF